METASSIATIPHENSSINYGEIVDAVNADMKTPASARVYGQTCRAWEAFCQQQDVNSLNLSPDHVRAFLLSKDTTRTTRARQLSALRKLAGKAHTYALLVAPEQAHIFEALRKLLDDMKAPASSQAARPPDLHPGGLIGGCGHIPGRIGDTGRSVTGDSIKSAWQPLIRGYFVDCNEMI